MTKGSLPLFKIAKLLLQAFRKRYGVRKYTGFFLIIYCHMEERQINTKVTIGVIINCFPIAYWYNHDQITVHNKLKRNDHHRFLCRNNARCCVEENVTGRWWQQMNTRAVMCILFVFIRPTSERFNQWWKCYSFFFI